MSKQDRDLLSIVPGSASGARVVDGDISYAIRRWKRNVKMSGKLKDVFDRQEYEKPSVKRRKIKSDAIYRQLHETD